jgi:hypothetical protein
LKFEKFKRFKRFEKFEKFERFKQVESIKRGRKFQTCTTQLKTWAMCKDICFLSGWAGYRELFPGLGGVEHFYVPFSPLGENDLKDIFLRHIHAQTLVAWSTGAHMILKWGDAVLNRFSHVVLVAPFLDFTRCLPVRIVKRMQDRFNKEYVYPGACRWSRVSVAFSLCTGSDCRYRYEHPSRPWDKGPDRSFPGIS